MGVGQLSESDAVDALRLPFYSSSHPTGSHGWRNQFDLGNPDYIGFSSGRCPRPTLPERDECEHSQNCARRSITPPCQNRGPATLT